MFCHSKLWHRDENVVLYGKHKYICSLHSWQHMNCHQTGCMRVHFFAGLFRAGAGKFTAHTKKDVLWHCQAKLNSLGMSQQTHTGPLRNMLFTPLLLASWQYDSRLSVTNLINLLLQWCWAINNERIRGKGGGDNQWPEVILKKYFYWSSMKCSYS